MDKRKPCRKCIQARWLMFYCLGMGIVGTLAVNNILFG